MSAAIAGVGLSGPTVISWYVAWLLVGITQTFAGTPLLYNWAESGKTPLLPLDDIRRLGFKLVIFPVSLLFAATYATLALLDTLKQGQTPSAFAGQSLTFAQFTQQERAAGRGVAHARLLRPQDRFGRLGGVEDGGGAGVDRDESTPAVAHRCGAASARQGRLHPASLAAYGRYRLVRYLRDALRLRLRSKCV